MTRPAPTYSRVGPIPNIPNSRPIATSLTRGLAIRKLSVTPRGTPRGDEPDERRDGAARAERGDDPESGGHDVADALTLAAEQRPGALDAHERAQHRDGKDDPDQQEGDLDRVLEEEVHP